MALAPVALLGLVGCWSPPAEPPIVIQQLSSEWSRFVSEGPPGLVAVRPFQLTGEETESARRGVAALLLALEESGRFVLVPTAELVAAPEPADFPPNLPPDLHPQLVLTGQVIACRPYPPQSFGLSLRFEDPLDGTVLWRATGVFDASSKQTRADLEAWVDESFANASHEGAHNEALLSLERFQRYVAKRWAEVIGGQ